MRHHERRPGDRLLQRKRVSPDPLQGLLARAYLRLPGGRLAGEPEVANQPQQLAEVVATFRELISRGAPFNAALNVIVDQARWLTNADGAAIALSENGPVLCRARCGLAPPITTAVDADSSFSAHCLRSGETLACDDTHEDPRIAPDWPRHSAVRSIVAVPVRKHGAITGILEVYSGRVRRFSELDIDSLRVLAGAITDALVRVHSESVVAAPDREQVEITITRDAGTELGTLLHPVLAPEYVPTNLEEHANWRVMFVVCAISAVVLIAMFGARWMRASTKHINAADSQRAIAPAVSPAPPNIAAAAAIDGVQSHSAADFTTVAVALNSPIHFVGKRLNHPERIYFDLDDSVIAGGTPHKVDINDARVVRVRAGRNENGTTRIVLDLNCACDYTAVQSSAPPFRLVIAVQSPTTAGGPAQTAKTSEKESPIPKSTTPLLSSNRPVAVPGLRILIDPGHGGSDIGAVGSGGLREKDLVLDVAQRLGNLIQKRRTAEVVYTREADVFVSLADRAALANSSDADLVISIHGNSSQSRQVKGVETFYSSQTHVAGAQAGVTAKQIAAASRKLAAALQSSLFTTLSASDRNLRDRGVKARELAVIERPGVPAVLTEISFLTSPEEEKKLSQPKYRDEIAEALYKGIASFVSTRKRGALTVSQTRPAVRPDTVIR